MLKCKNLVVTREQLNEAKELHARSYNEFVEKRRKKYDATIHSGLIGSVVFATAIMQLRKPRTMKQCIKEVTSNSNKQTQEVENGI